MSFNDTKSREVMRDLRKEKDDFLKSRRAAAAQRMQRDLDAWNSRKHNVQGQWKNALLYSVVNGQASMMQNWGLPQHIKAMVSRFFAAYTNYAAVYMEWCDFPMFNAPTEDIAAMVIKMKAVLQHEIGHLRFSIHPSELASMISSMHIVHNVLEDQRMECLVVEDVPIMAKYFLPMINDIVLGGAVPTTAWLYVAGRTYLPDEVRTIAYDLFNAYVNRSCHFDDVGRDFSSEYLAHVNVYKAANSAASIVQATEDTYYWLSQLGVSTSETSSHPEPANDGIPQQADPASTARDASIEDLLGKRDPGQGGEDKSLDKAMNAAAASATKDLLDSKDLNNMINNAAGAMRASGLGGAPITARVMTADEQIHAEQISEGMERALNTFVTESAPRWENHQSRGVIDAMAFRSKQVGDINFYRCLNGSLGAGLDVHVSILADNSGSMSSNMVQLSQFMYGSVSACERLGISTTSVLWSDRDATRRIWEDGARAEVLVDEGSTDPTCALDDLDTHNEDGKTDHLVLVFTDGEWYGNFPSLSQWNRPGRHIVYINFGRGNVVREMGAHEHISITDLEELAPLLMSALTRVMSS